MPKGYKPSPRGWNKSWLATDSYSPIRDAERATSSLDKLSQGFITLQLPSCSSSPCCVCLASRRAPSPLHAHRRTKSPLQGSSSTRSSLSFRELETPKLPKPQPGRFFFQASSSAISSAQQTTPRALLPRPVSGFSFLLTLIPLPPFIFWAFSITRPCPSDVPAAGSGPHGVRFPKRRQRAPNQGPRMPGVPERSRSTPWTSALARESCRLGSTWWRIWVNPGKFSPKLIHPRAEKCPPAPQSRNRYAQDPALITDIPLPCPWSDPSLHLFIRGSYTRWATGRKASRLAVAKFCNFSSKCTFPCPFAPNFSRRYPPDSLQGAVTLQVVGVNHFVRNFLVEDPVF